MQFLFQPLVLCPQPLEFLPQKYRRRMRFPQFSRQPPHSLFQLFQSHRRGRGFRLCRLCIGQHCRRLFRQHRSYCLFHRFRPQSGNAGADALPFAAADKIGVGCPFAVAAGIAACAAQPADCQPL